MVAFSVVVSGFSVVSTALTVVTTGASVCACVVGASVGWSVAFSVVTTTGAEVVPGGMVGAAVVGAGGATRATGAWKVNEPTTTLFLTGRFRCRSSLLKRNHAILIAFYLKAYPVLAIDHFELD